MSLRTRRLFFGGLTLIGLVAVALLAASMGSATSTATNNKVLILGPTVSGGTGSREAQAAVLAGRTVDVVSAATWGAMTTAQFAAYDAIILGDPTCYGYGSPIPGPYAAAVANASTWAAAVTGNVIINGTDPTFHAKTGLINPSVKFAVDSSSTGKTGAYISLSCLYHYEPQTTVTMLAGFGTFTAGGVGSCYNNAHIVASHPSLASLNDAYLSNWGCSVHEGFGTWPLSFEVLAIARDSGSAYTASDGSVGTPYIVARGVTVISDIRLTPESDINPINTNHTVNAHVAEDGTPRAGVTVTFKVIAGPNNGVTGTGVTNAAGDASFTYLGSGGPGTDTIEATFVDSLGRTQRSNRVQKIWEAPRIADLQVTKVDLADPIKNGDSVTYKIEVKNNGPAAAANAQLNDTLSGPGTISAVTTDTGSCTNTATTVSCSLGSLASGAVATIHVTVASNDDGTLSDTASASSENPDDAPGNNSDNETTTVDGVADVTVTKSGSSASVLWGANVTYTVVVSNAGPDTAAGIDLTDAVAGPGTFVSGSAAGGPCTVSGGLIHCPVGDLAPGASSTVTIIVHADSPGTIHDKAHAETPTYEADKANNGAEADTDVLRHPTSLTYTGQSTEDYHDPATVSGRLVDTSNASPIGGASVTFSIAAQSCSGTTNAAGDASCSITPNVAAGPYPRSASYAGSPLYEPSSDNGTFVVRREETTTTYTGANGPILNGSTATLSGVLKEDGVTPIAGRTLLLTLGSQSCSATTNGSGSASCTVTVAQPLGPGTASAKFAGDAFYLPSADSDTTLIFAGAPGGGAFVIGNRSTAGTVYFWGSQWWKENDLSGGDAPAAFKGFAKSPASPACGVNWSTGPGNSPPPPASIPAYMGVIVSSSIDKSGSSITGNTVRIVVVKTNPGYDDSPGHPGTGKVVATVC